jgi:ABC-type transport system involved in multi-copper enzyme maturation permease subunit
MDLMGYYLLFAFSTSLTACYFWFWPMLQEAIKKSVNNALTRAPVLSIVIYIMVTALIAPVIVLPLLVPTMGEKFARGLQREIMKQD